MKIVRPFAITDANLTTSATEAAPNWNALTPYVVGDVVAYNRRRRRCELSNTGKNPETGNTPTLTYWIDIGPTNPWAMFDNKTGTQTTMPSEIAVGIDVVGFADTIGLLNLDAATVNVRIHEGSNPRTNLLIRTREFDNAAWVKAQSSVTANAVVAPDGTMTADALIEDTTPSNTHYMRQNTSWTSGTTYTNSIFAKERPGSAKRYLRLLFPGGGGAGFAVNYSAVFDLAAGTFITANGPVAAGMVDHGNGWWRCWVSAEANATIASNVHVRLTNNYSPGLSTYNGDGASGIYVWGAQLETGNRASQYIPTDGSPVTVLGEDTFNEDYPLIDDSAVVDYYEYFFEPIVRKTDLVISNLPGSLNPLITVTLEDADDVSIGHLVLGQSRQIGGTLHGATIGITDYSRFEEDEIDGNVFIVERAFVRTGRFNVRIESGQVDTTYNLISGYRATPLLIIASEKYASTLYFGLLRDAQIEIDYPTYSLMSVEVRGF